MNLEPREIRLPRRLVPSVRPSDTSLVLDEAFASVTEADFRCDEAHDAPQAAANRAETAELAEQVRQQLEALRDQQTSLTALLDSLSK